MASYYLQPTLGNVDVNFCDLAKLPKPSSGCLTKKQWNELQQWTQQYGGSVRQNTRRNFSTKDKSGTWPLNLYHSAPLDQHSVDFDVLLNEDIPAQQDTSTTHNVVITQSMYVVVSQMYKPHSALNSPLYYKTIRGRCWRLWQWWVCQNSLSHPGCCRSAIIYHFWRITCHPKRGDQWGSKQHYSCWQWKYWNRWGGVLSAPGLVEQVHWHHLLQWSWWRTFCWELLWGTRWWRFNDHVGWSAAKEAKEGSEQWVSLLLRCLIHF